MGVSFLTALPVYNEARHVVEVLSQVRRYSREILVIDDGSTDGTAELLRAQPDLRVITHPTNRGYGAALQSAFAYAQQERFEVLVTIDCDGQHEPKRIPRFVKACASADIVSGSRYLRQFAADSPPPEERRTINLQVTRELNHRLGLHLTDAFCGFKAYKVESLSRLNLEECGYAMPLEVWVQVAKAGLKVIELPVPRIYLDEKRSFGGALDNARTRLEYYHLVVDRSMAKAGLWEPQCDQPACCGESSG